MARPEHVHLEFLHSFGSVAYTDIKNSVCLSDDDTNSIIYPAGRHIAVRSLETDDINYIREPDRVTKITAMAITKEKSRRFLAVAEYVQMENTPLVSIFDLKSGAYFKRMRQLGFPDMSAEEFKCLGFSSDSRNIVATSGPPDYIGIVWDWYRDKLIGKYAFASKISRITINPKDPYLLCTTGPNHWKTWKIEEKSFKPQPPFSGMDRTQNYIDHDWVDDDTVVAVSDNGEAFVARGTELIQIIEFPFGKASDAIQSSSIATISSLYCYSKGFFFGSSEGTISFWNRVVMHDSPQGEVFVFDFVRSWSTGRSSHINSLSLSNNEETLGISHSNNDIGICNVSKIFQEDTEVKVEIFCQGFHRGPITAMDVAVQRPLLVTCSQTDASVRIWNYVTFKCEVAKRLRHDKDAAGSEAINRPLLSVAFHPSGYYIAVGFEDKVRIFHLLFDDLRFFREINIKNATCLRFSTSGHLLAAVSSKMVYIYTSFTLEQVDMLKAHTSAIQDLTWSKNDQKIATVGIDGGVYVFDMYTGQKDPEHVSRNTEYSSVAFIENDMVVTCGLESQHSIILEQNFGDWKTHSFGLRPKLSQIHYFRSYHGTPCFISGCHAGNVQIYGPGPANAFLEELVVHNGSVLKLCSSHDGRYVFSGGEDGVIFIYHVIEPRDLQPQMERIQVDNKEKDDFLVRTVDEKLADIVLIPKSQLEWFKGQLESIRAEMENIRQKRDYNIQQQDLTFEEQRKELEKALHQEYKVLESRYEQIRDEKMKKEREWVERLGNLERAHNNAIDTVETLYEKKLTLEDEKYRKMEKDKSELKSYYEEQISVLQKQNDEAIEHLASAFKDSLKKTQDDYEETRKTAEDLKLIYEERLSQQEDEHEAEIQEMRKNYEGMVEKQSIENTRVRRENETLTSEQQMFSEEKEAIRIKNEKKKSTISALDKSIAELKAHKDQLEAEKKEKEDLLVQKENKIQDYKNQVKDLDKKKHVLDARKKEILDEIQPKDKEIGDLKEELKKLHNDCDRERKINTDLKKKIGEKEEQVDNLRGEGSVLQGQTNDRAHSLRAITNDIYDIVNNVEQKAWIDEMKKLYIKYVKNELGKVSKKDPECVEEMEEQLRFMSKSINIMKQSLSQSHGRSKADMRKRTIENSTLIQELHDLRKTKKSNELMIKQLEYRHKAIQQAITASERKEGKMQGKQPSTAQLPSIAPLPIPQPRAKSAKSRSLTQTGKLYKGSPFESKLINLQDKQRISELAKELEEKKEENFYLKVEINRLRDMLSQEGSPNVEEANLRESLDA